MTQRKKTVGLRIKDYFRLLSDGSLCLPEFQRDFVWKPKQVADLWMSIIRKYPIGWFLFLDRKENDHIEPRSIINISQFSFTHCKYLIIDGQQRLTSIYRVLNSSENGIFEFCEKPCILFFDLKKFTTKEIYNVDNEFIKPWRPSTREKCQKYIEDYSKQIENKELAFSVFLDKKEFQKWIRKARGKIGKETIKLLRNKRRDLEYYDISFDLLDYHLENSVLCNIFYKINNTGTKLDVFDLMVAEFEKINIDLRKKWKNAKTKFHSFIEFDIDPMSILRIIVLVRKAINNPNEIKHETCSEEDVKKMSELYSEDKKKDFESDWRNAVENLNETLGYYKSKFGVDSEAKNPYSSMLITYAAVLWWWEDNIKRNSEGMLDILSTWYWRSVFKQRYSAHTIEVIADDFKMLRELIQNSASNISTKTLQRYRVNDLPLQRLTSNRDAIYRGILCLPRANKAEDLIASKDSTGLYVEDHHIFPKAWFKKTKSSIDPELINCVVNRTFILGKAHDKIHANPPSEYFKNLLSEDIFTEKIKHGLKDRLKKHFIDENVLQCIKNDDFLGFLEKREKLMQEEMKRRT
jgi:hypothetical protein